MKILITGASGLVGTILRDVYRDCDVTLLSRTRLQTRHNEQWYQSRNISNDLWWSELPANKVYDVVFHLAEPTKEKLERASLESVVEGHIKFITYMLCSASRLIYPLTAYLYDDKLSNRNKSYTEIKRRVFLSLSRNSKISFPVIHPLCDYGNGLNSLIRIHRRIPYANFFCRFDACLPVLRLDEFKRRIIALDSIPAGKSDLYSEQIPISNIFFCSEKANLLVLSSVLYYLMFLGRALPCVHLLTNGRNIRELISQMI